ncbi:unnamed protein product [Didymodactylos carnosus]|uniref:Uncharacterized protein n=1 Tax=Didymodactylos carnosus TaxID=1234261 RepID=A0A8S2EDV8_9BILA|nr:unnamed protein product [Didymodactylos carnosus]CAF3990743.1 unnamed protein product [Didymodactylos carnosus]
MTDDSAKSALTTPSDMTKSVFNYEHLLTNSTINSINFGGLTTSVTSSTSDYNDNHHNNRNSSLFDGIGMCESMTESYCSVATSELGDDGTITNSPDTTITTNGTPGPKLEKKDSSGKNMLKKRRSRRAQYDAEGHSPHHHGLDKIEIVNIEEQNEFDTNSDESWLCQAPRSIRDPSPNLISWVHKEFKSNDISATKHRLLCKLDDMSNARTIRSMSCHNFPAGQENDGVKRSNTSDEVKPVNSLTEHVQNYWTNTVRENVLYLLELINPLDNRPPFLSINDNKSIDTTKIFQSNSVRKLSLKMRLLTLSMDSINSTNENDDRLSAYDSLDDDNVQESDVWKNKCLQENILKAITNERYVIENLTKQCSLMKKDNYQCSMDSLDLEWDDAVDTLDNNIDSLINIQSISQQQRTASPGVTNSNTRPVSPVRLSGTSPLRHGYTINPTSTTISSITRSRDVSRERELYDYTDVEVMAKIQLENLRQSEKQGPLSKRHGGSTNTLLGGESRDSSPASVFAANVSNDDYTKYQHSSTKSRFGNSHSPVSRHTSTHSGQSTPRRSHSPNPSANGYKRKNSYVVTESQYANVLPSVSPRSASPATQNWSGRGTPTIPSQLETCLETSYINTDSFDADDDQQQIKLNSYSLQGVNSTNELNRTGGSNISLASTNSHASSNSGHRASASTVRSSVPNKPPAAPKAGVKTNAGPPKQNYRRSTTQTITTSNNYKVPVVDNANMKLNNGLVNQSRSNLLPSNQSKPPTTTTRQSSNRPIYPYRGSQTQVATYPSQTNYNNNANDIQSVKHQQPPAPPQRGTKVQQPNFGSTYTTNQLAEATAYINENNLLSDVINKPVVPVRAVLPQRRTILPQSSVHSSNEKLPATNVETNGHHTMDSVPSSTIPRSSSTLSQGRKSGLPLPVGNQLKRPSIASVSR